MDYIRTGFFIFMMVSCLVDGRGRRRSKRGNGKCNEYSFAEYNLTFFGDWSKEMFPRMYPRYRPKAQWSQLIGRTHGRTYHMWSEGHYASVALKKFVEETSTLLFDTEAQGYNDTRDHFTAAPIRGGVGRSSLRIFADGTHSKLSFVVKVVPSPDWFVGVDSLDLCKNGHWRRKIYAHLRPMDAGTDRGYTYTSPNWPSFPPEKIFQITPKCPNHPANSFYDENLPRVPRMAHAIIEKVVEFRKKGSPRMPLDSGPNVVVYEQEHERQERLRLVSRPTDAETTNSQRYKLTNSDYLTNLNSQLQRRLRGQPVVTRHTFLVEKLSTSEAAPLKNSSSSAFTIYSRQHGIENTLRDSPTNVAIHPPRFSSSVPDKPSSTFKIITEEPISASSLEVEDQEPTPEVVETKSESMETDSEGVERELDVQTDPQAVVTNYKRLYLTADSAKEIGTSYTEEIRPITQQVHQKHLVKSSTHEVQLDDFSQTDVYPNTDLQTVYSSTSNKLTHSAASTSSETAPTLSSTEVETDERGDYSEAYRTDYMKNFATQDNTDSMFGILSDTPTQGYVTDVDTTEAETTEDDVAESTESMETETPLYVEESSRSRGRDKVVPVSVNKETVTETGHVTESEHHYQDDTEEDNTGKKESSYQETRSDNVENEGELDLDCIVAEWSEWSSCSKTCGFGVKTRARSVRQYSENGGLPCPRLDQEALCGSMRNCKWNYFSNIFKKDRKRRRRRLRHTRHG